MGKVWILYNGDEESPAECRYFSDDEDARQTAMDIVELSARPGSRYEWRHAVAGPGLPVYSGPAPVVVRPELWPDYEALFEIRPDGTESCCWQLNSALVDEPEPEPRRALCPDDPEHGIQDVMSIACDEDSVRIPGGWRLACLHAAVLRIVR